MRRGWIYARGGDAPRQASRPDGGAPASGRTASTAGLPPDAVADEMVAAFAPQLAELAREASGMRLRAGLAGAAGLVGILLMVAGNMMSPRHARNLIIEVVSIVVGLAAVLALKFAGDQLKAHQNRYKLRIFRRVVERFFPDLTYKPLDGIPADVFRASLLYDDSYLSYASEDDFSGEIAGLAVRFSEVKVVRDAGRKRNDLFHGVLFVIDLPEGAREPVLVHSVGLFQKLWDSLASGWKRRYGELVRIGDDAFDARFRVLASSADAARAALSPALRRALPSFADKLRASLQLSIVDRRMYIAVPRPGDVFDPDFMRPRDDRGRIRTFVAEVRELHDFVEQIAREKSSGRQALS